METNLPRKRFYACRGILYVLGVLFSLILHTASRNLRNLRAAQLSNLRSSCFSECNKAGERNQNDQGPVTMDVEGGYMSWISCSL